MCICMYIPFSENLIVNVTNYKYMLNFDICRLIIFKYLHVKQIILKSGMAEPIYFQYNLYYFHSCIYIL